MCPPKKGKAAPPPKAKGRGSNAQSQPIESPKPKLQIGSGWNIDNLSYFHSIPPENVSDELYKMFGIPSLYKNDESHVIVNLYIEFQTSSFMFAKSLNDPAKELMVLAILGDYFASIPSFKEEKESFDRWSEKAFAIFSKNESIQQNEMAAITEYINRNLKEINHIYFYILTDESIQQLDPEGMSLFKPIPKEVNEQIPKEQQEQQQQQEQQAQPAQQLENSLNLTAPKNDLEEQLAAAALAEKNNEENKEKEKQIALDMEKFIQENFQNIQGALDRRKETILTEIGTTQARLDAIMKGKAPR